MLNICILTVFCYWEKSDSAQKNDLVITQQLKMCSKRNIFGKFDVIFFFLGYLAKI